MIETKPTQNGKFKYPKKSQDLEKLKNQKINQLSKMKNEWDFGKSK
jgi:hypothetical protein